MSTVSSSNSNSYLDSLSKSSASSTLADSATSAQETSEQFLTLLVTQLQNQDPMNPVDNAEMTSQMAQISTVSGIEKLNTTVESLTGQIVQMQAMQGASLVGKDVLVEGDKMSVVDGVPQATFEIGSAASKVTVEVLSPAGKVVDTINLSTTTAGRHDVQWTAGSELENVDTYRFRVSASSGSTSLSTTALMRDKVDAVNTSGSSLTLELERSGRVAYSDITAID